MAAPWVGGSWSEKVLLSADKATRQGLRLRVGMSAAGDGRRPSLGLVEARMDKETVTHTRKSIGDHRA